MTLVERMQVDMAWWTELVLATNAYREGQRMGGETRRQMTAATASRRIR